MKFRNKAPQNESDPFAHAFQEELAPNGAFRNALENPDLRNRAVTLAKGVGTEALSGAIEASGVIKTDRRTGESKVSAFGVARAVVNPAGALRRAAKGGVEGARDGASQQIRQAATEAVQSWGAPALQNIAPSQFGSIVPDSDPFAAPPNTDPFAGTAAPSYNNDPFASAPTPTYNGKSDPFAAPSYAPGPSFAPNSSSDPFAPRVDSFNSGPQADPFAPNPAYVPHP